MSWLALATPVIFGTNSLSLRAADVAELEQQAFTRAVEQVAGAVVQIQPIGGLDQVGDRQFGQGPTTGLIVAADGYIIASAFGFAQEPTSIVVRLPGGDQRPAELVGRDNNRMLVLLKVHSDEPLPAPTAAPLSAVRPGDWAIAVGRAFGTEQPNLSVGIVSAVGRMHGRALQTDANVSASNYGGPLVDVRGRVLGILVPMAPQSGSGASEANVTAGAEFYDSGIGFAVPLEDVLAVLERWKREKDLHRGVLGVGLKNGNPHATAPVVTAVWPGSPAAKAGWKPDDRIVAVEGEPVDTQTQLRFQVAPRYAGDTLRVTLRRAKEKQPQEIETEVTLVDKLPPFRHAFLGVLPDRAATAKADERAADASADGPQEAATEPAQASGDAPDEPTPSESDGAAAEDNGDEQEEQDAAAGSAGVVVRVVWPGGPAAKAGIERGDRLTRLGDQPVASFEQAVGQLNAAVPGASLAASLVRDGREQTVDVVLSELPSEILSAADLPARAAYEVTGAAGEAIELQELKLPEMPQTARYLAPAEGDEPLALLIWLGARGEAAAQEQAKRWQQACRRAHVLLLLPEPGAEAGWSSDDAEYLDRLLQTALARFDVDPARIVIGGEGRGGQLAYATALGNRRFVRGVVAVDSPLPRTLVIPDNSPTQRFAVLAIETSDAPLGSLIRKDLQRLSEAGFPVTRLTRPATDAANTLDSSTRAQIGRWIDALDRL